MMTDDCAVELISKISRMCFAGSLPNDEIFIDAVMVALKRTLDGQPQAVLDRFRNELCQGLADLRLAQTVSSSGLVN